VKPGMASDFQMIVVLTVMRTLSMSKGLQPQIPKAFPQTNMIRPRKCLRRFTNPTITRSY
jgi:hypothetical protein